jgi:cyanate lyase
VLSLFAAFKIANKKKKKIILDDKLIVSLNLVAEDLRENYSDNKKVILRLLTQEIKKKYKFNNQQISSLIELKQDIEIPSNIFVKELGGLEAIVKYLVENLNLSYREISELLNRDERTIWTAYHKARTKYPDALKVASNSEKIPLKLIQHENLTIFEAIVLHKKNLGFKFTEIAKLLGRDQRNIWTIYSRASRRLSAQK